MKIQVPAAEAEVYLMYSRNTEETSEHVCSVVRGVGGRLLHILDFKDDCKVSDFYSDRGR